jgi:hypothetical protein
MSVRRVVTGFDADGQPAVLSDGPAPCEVTMPPEIGASAGDTFVHRGPRHAWVNTGKEACRLVCSSVAATLATGIEPG